MPRRLSTRTRRAPREALRASRLDVCSSLASHAGTGAVSMARPPGLALSKEGARTTSISGVIWVVRRACDERHITGGEACMVHDEVPKGGCARSHTVR